MVSALSEYEFRINFAGPSKIIIWNREPNKTGTVWSVCMRRAAFLQQQCDLFRPQVESRPAQDFAQSMSVCTELHRKTLLSGQGLPVVPSIEVIHDHLWF